MNLVEKNSLFFNKYRYSARFDLDELGIIRSLKLEKIDKIVEDRNRWRTENQMLYRNYKQGQVTDEQVRRLKIVCSLLNAHKNNIKFVVSYDRGYVYTNDLTVVEEIKGLNFIDRLYTQEVVEICPPGTIALNNPQWSHRTYFKSLELTDHQITTLTEYLKNRQGIRLSPGLKGWMNVSRKQYWHSWTQSYFFFDHNDDGEVLFLNMVVPRITRRTMQIVAK